LNYATGTLVKILLVEDNAVQRELLSSRLSRRGYEIVLAADGQEAVDAARLEGPDVILMDLDLPVLDGWEATRQIKADPVTTSIPVLVLTSNVSPADQETAFEAGADAYDTKPVELERLLTKIGLLLGHS
jgi:two-component system cell cycle response regulator DivK